MQLNTNTRRNRVSKVMRIVSKIILPLLIILVLIYFLGKLEMPAPEKHLKKQIPNDKLIIVK